MAVYRHMHVSAADGVTVARLLDREIRGEADGAAWEQEFAQLVEAERGRDVLLDFSQVEHVTSSAVVQLIILHKLVAAKNGRLKLCHLRPEVYDVFTVMHLDSMFDVEETAAAALANFKVPPAVPLGLPAAPKPSRKS